jgi:hypothetical protein
MVAVIAMELKITARRTQALRKVGSGRVSYDARTAAYLTDGKPASGWGWRTYSEMRTAGWIDVEGGVVVLTPEGKEILEG